MTLASCHCLCGYAHPAQAGICDVFRPVTAVRRAGRDIPVCQPCAAAQAAFTCPRCSRTSHHPEDLRQGYCGACHDWTGDAARVAVTELLNTAT